MRERDERASGMQLAESTWNSRRSLWRRLMLFSKAAKIEDMEVEERIVLFLEHHGYFDEG